MTKMTKITLLIYFKAGITPWFTMFVDIRTHFLFISTHLGRESLLRLGSKERSKENHDCGFHLLSIFVTFVDFKQLLITLVNTPQSRPTFVSELILESLPGDWRELEQNLSATEQLDCSLLVSKRLIVARLASSPHYFVANTAKCGSSNSLLMHHHPFGRRRTH